MQIPFPIQPIFHSKQPAQHLCASACGWGMLHCAGVAQWQSSTSQAGYVEFDSHHPLQHPNKVHNIFCPLPLQIPHAGNNKFF